MEDESTAAPASAGGKVIDSATLADRIRSGDRDAEKLLVDRFQRTVMIILERHTGGRPEAEDLFQETFLTAVRKLRAGELREPRALPGFVTQVARNLAIEHYRKLRRRQTESNSDDLEAVVAESNPFTDVRRRQNAEVVRAVLGQLTQDRDRQILFRYYLAEEDREEIAEDFGLSPGQLRKLLHRARERYRQQLLRLHGTALSLGLAVFAIVCGSLSFEGRKRGGLF